MMGKRWWKKVHFEDLLKNDKRKVLFERMKENQQNIRASLLDRLLDDEPEVSLEPVRRQMATVRQIKAAVARDLENLLNSKNFYTSLPPAYKELNGSLFVYGLPDFTSSNPRSPSVRFRLRQELMKAIAQFEPRLRNVTVRIEDPEENERNLRFKITALLILDPAAEPVTFDTVFDINRCEYSVSK